MKCEPLSRGAYKCLKYIKSYDFQKRGWSCPSQETLSKDLRVNVSSIKRYVSELRQKYYLSVNRRPNSSSIYHFGLRSAQSEPTVGSKNEPAGKPAGEPTIQLVLKHRNTQETTMQMPAFLTLPSEQKLWRMAQRWITENKPPLITGLDVGPIMMQLEGAGALDLAEDATLPEIVWPPQLARDRILASQVMTNEANRDTRRKPMAKAEADLRSLQRRINGTE